MSKFVDPYIDPETGVLRNLAGARTYDELLNVEGEFVAMRTNEFLEQHSAFRPSGTLEDLCLIHRSLFGTCTIGPVKFGLLKSAKRRRVRNSSCPRRT